MTHPTRALDGSAIKRRRPGLRRSDFASSCCAAHRPNSSGSISPPSPNQYGWGYARYREIGRFTLAHASPTAAQAGAGDGGAVISPLDPGDMVFLVGGLSGPRTAHHTQHGVGWTRGAGKPVEGTRDFMCAGAISAIAAASLTAGDWRHWKESCCSTAHPASV